MCSQTEEKTSVERSGRCCWIEAAMLTQGEGLGKKWWNSWRGWLPWVKEDALSGRNKVFWDGEGRSGIDLSQIGDNHFLSRLLKILNWEGKTVLEGCGVIVNYSSRYPHPQYSLLVQAQTGEKKISCSPKASCLTARPIVISLFKMLQKPWAVFLVCF